MTFGVEIYVVFSPKSTRIQVETMIFVTLNKIASGRFGLVFDAFLRKPAFYDNCLRFFFCYHTRIYGARCIRYCVLFVM